MAKDGIDELIEIALRLLRAFREGRYTPVDLFIVALIIALLSVRLAIGRRGMFFRLAPRLTPELQRFRRWEKSAQ